MREYQAAALVIASVAGLAASISSPELFAKNSFLVNFVNHEYVNVLAVLVTVSMVSVVQIHLEYTRIERRFNMRVFGDARKAVNTSAVVLASLLCGSFFLSFLRAEVAHNETWTSIVHIAALLTILEGIFIMYDLVATVCTMAEEEPIDEEDD